MKRIIIFAVLCTVIQFSLLGNNQSIPFEIEIKMDSTSALYLELEKELRYSIQESLLGNNQFELKSTQDSLGHVILVEIFKWATEKRSDGFVGELDLNLRVLDDTKNLIFTKNLNYHSLSSKVDKLSKRVASFGLKKPEKLSSVQGKLLLKTQNDLLQSFLKSFKSDLNICLNELFPSCLPVIEIVKEKNEEAQSILILKDKGQDMKKGDELELLKVTKMEYQEKSFTRMEPFGKVKVQIIEGDFVRCKVTKGKKELWNYLKSSIVVMAKKQVKKDKLKKLVGLTGL